MLYTQLIYMDKLFNLIKATKQEKPEEQGRKLISSDDSSTSISNTP
jgi:hypothetical protein